MIAQFNTIHESQQLNQLLYDNIIGLERLYEDCKLFTQSKTFTVEAAQIMLMDLEDKKLKVSLRMINTAFVFC